jgi:hypothetical protein
MTSSPSIRGELLAKLAQSGASPEQLLSMMQFMLAMTSKPKPETKLIPECLRGYYAELISGKTISNEGLVQLESNINKTDATSEDKQVLLDIIKRKKERI